jgi:hypothetical protein
MPVHAAHTSQLRTTISRADSDRYHPFMKLAQRWAACVFASMLLAFSATGDAAAVTVRAGNQCKKRDLGKQVGTLRCTKVGSRYVWVGAKGKQGDCHPAYTPCVPIDSDVDCAGGSGNGPSYVQGPVTVINPGDDPYGLDKDGDGIGCEKK